MGAFQWIIRIITILSMIPMAYLAYTWLVRDFKNVPKLDLRVYFVCLIIFIVASQFIRYE